MPNQSFKNQTPRALRDGFEGGWLASEGASREGESGHDASPSFHYRIIIYCLAIYHIDGTRCVIHRSIASRGVAINRKTPPLSKPPADVGGTWKFAPLRALAVRLRGRGEGTRRFSDGEGEVGTVDHIENYAATEPAWCTHKGSLSWPDDHAIALSSEHEQRFV